MAHDDLFALLDKYLPAVIPEKSVLAVTSKIVALCEGRIADPTKYARDELVVEESSYYIPKQYNKYGFCLSIKNHTLIASAGIDESNGDGNFVLWPADPQKSANQIRRYVRDKWSLSEFGVILTDSHILPMRWGTQGTAIAYSGFQPLKNYIGLPDIFNRKLKVTRANHAEGLAAAAVLCMGEGDEQTPLAILTDLDFIQFFDHDPSEKELRMTRNSLEDDVYAPLLVNAKWKVGGEKSK